jgi:hypothetical protein
MKKVEIILVLLAIPFLAALILVKPPLEDYTECIIDLDEVTYDSEAAARVGKQIYCQDKKEAILAYEQCREDVNDNNLLQVKQVVSIAGVIKPSIKKNYPFLRNLVDNHNEECEEYPNTLVVR